MGARICEHELKHCLQLGEVGQLESRFEMLDSVPAVPGPASPGSPFHCDPFHLFPVLRRNVCSPPAASNGSTSFQQRSVESQVVADHLRG